MAVGASYLPIPINEFIQGVNVPVDLYVRLSENKYVAVARAGTVSDVSQFRKFQNRDVEYV